MAHMPRARSWAAEPDSFSKAFSASSARFDRNAATWLCVGSSPSISCHCSRCSHKLRCCPRWTCRSFLKVARWDTRARSCKGLSVRTQCDSNPQWTCCNPRFRSLNKSSLVAFLSFNFWHKAEHCFRSLSKLCLAFSTLESASFQSNRALSASAKARTLRSVPAAAGAAALCSCCACCGRPSGTPSMHWSNLQDTMMQLCELINKISSVDNQKGKYSFRFPIVHDTPHMSEGWILLFLTSSRSNSPFFRLFFWLVSSCFSSLPLLTVWLKEFHTYQGFPFMVWAKTSPDATASQAREWITTCAVHMFSSKAPPGKLF